MGLQTSGAISLQDIATEFGGTAPHTLSEYYGKGNAPASGAITIGGNFYGTSNQFAFTITSNQTNANLATLATNAGWDGASALVATINSGVYISSNSTGTPALTVSGTFAGGVTLVNNGYIVGRGGNGGTGSMPQYAGDNQSAGSGSSGGGALLVSSTITIANNGTIGGGGGGGGGGGHRVTDYPSPYQYISGGGGGGGRSSQYNSSGGGIESTSQSPKYYGTSGGSGTVSSAGSGGARGFYTSTGKRYGGNGGNGGNWGAGGSAGAAGGDGYGSPGGGGGGAGYAVSGNGNITWGATGTRLGAIS